MKYLLLLSILLLSTLVGFAQPKPDLDSLPDLSYDHYSYYHFDSALEVAEAVEDLAIRTGDSVGILRARFYKEIARQEREENQY